MLAVPFYKREDLVERVFGNLRENIVELKSEGVQVVIINDSPNYVALQLEITRHSLMLEGIEWTLIENEKNLGFVKSCNKVFELGVQMKQDVLLFNSDCLLTPGAITEIISVASSDEKIAFVCPRSNNATIATLPHGFENNKNLHDAHAAFQSINKLLPKYSYAPTAVGFCFLAKWTVLSEFGFFDEIYGKGYNEENDLVMRANRAGYRAALANHAFVWHEGSQSFVMTSSTPNSRDSVNGKILRKRYPEYEELVSRFINSPERLAERLLIAAKIPNKKRIIFDFSHVGTYHNGTFEVAKNIAKHAIARYSDSFEFAILMQKASWEFHEISSFAGEIRIEVEDATQLGAAIVRVGQPFETRELERIFSRAAVSVIYMQDTIAMDIGKLSLEFNLKVWHKVMDHASLVISISKFTEEQLRSRFSKGFRTRLETKHLSLRPSDYAQPIQSKPHEVEPYIFVVGNGFEHKFVAQTVRQILDKTHRKVVSLGGPIHSNEEKFRHINFVSGNLDEEKLESIWQKAEIIVFPSHYEGFGLPIFHALARHKPVFVRDTRLNRELAALAPSSANIHFFTTTAELITLIEADNVQWNSKSEKSSNLGNGWPGVAEHLIHSIEMELRNLNYGAVFDRTKVAVYDLSENSIHGAQTPAAKVGKQVENLIEHLLRIPGVKSALKPLYNLVSQRS